MAALAKLITPGVAVPVLCVVAGIAVCFLVMRIVAAKKTPQAGAGVSGSLKSLLSNPILSHVVTLAARRAHETSHAVLDAAVVKMLPGLAPFTPIINAAADQIDARVAGAPPPPLPQPGDPATRPVIDFLESHLALLKGAPKP